MKNQFPIIGVGSLLLILSGVDPACSGATLTITQNLDVAVSPSVKVSVPGSLSLVYNGGSFLNYTGSSVVSYKARTASSSSAKIGIRVSSEFSPASGPSAASGHLTYTCSSATLGTACSGTVTASTVTSQTIVSLPAQTCTGGGAPCSSADPNTITLQFGLRNLPAFATGTYSGQLLYTASAL